MLKKAPATIVLILLIALSFSPLLSSAYTTTSSTIYVDDDNTQGPWDGSLAHPYRHIQDALNASLDGDTVFVFNGLYNESVTIRQSIVLNGEDWNNTIICVDDNVDVIKVNARGVKVTGFTIMHTDTYWFLSQSQGIFINCKHNAHDCVIEGNIITKCYVGIVSSYCKNTTIKNNVITNNKNGLWARISSDGLSENTIANNIISSNDYSGAILNSRGDLFYNNTVCNNSRGVSVIFSENQVYQNEIFENGLGISVRGENVIVEHNIIHNNSGTGVRVSSKFSTVRLNTISGNHDYGVAVTYDTDPYNFISQVGFGNTISCNNIVDNGVDSTFTRAFLTHWKQNYWGTENSAPYIIHGGHRFNRINIDWSPATEPFDITNGGQV